MRALLILIVLSGCAHSPPRPAGLTSQAAAEFVALDERIQTDTGPTRQDQELRQLEALERAGLLALASRYASALVRDAEHPHRLAALELLLRLQEHTGDETMHALLATSFADASLALSPSAAARLAWVKAQHAFRVGRLEHALEQAALVPPDSSAFAKAQLVRALALTSPSLPGGPRLREAAQTLQALLTSLGPHHEAVDAVRAQALLALARVTYQQRDWANSVRWYDEAAKEPRARTQALFEQGYALLRAGHPERALQNLDRAEVRAAHLPEAATLGALISFFSGDVRGAAAKVEVMLARAPEVPPLSKEDAVKAFRTGVGVPPAVLSAARERQSVVRTCATLDALQAELQRVETSAELEGTATRATFVKVLSTARDGQLESCATRSFNTFQELRAIESVCRANADLLGVEAALGNGDLDLAIARLTRLTGEVTGGWPGSELRFRLAALKQARLEALPPEEVAAARAEVKALLRQVVEGDATWERIDEAKRLLDEP